MDSDGRKDLIRAAGALLWQECNGSYTVAVVHRNRYDDWTLPKGKLQEGETWQSAALREVKEETGYDACVLDFAGVVGYEVEGKPKIVRYWHMLAQGEPSQKTDDEVDSVLWLPMTKALERLQYPLEISLLEQATHPSRFSPGLPKKSRWFGLEQTSALRLGYTLEQFEQELEAIIDDAKSRGQNNNSPNWHRRSRRLLKLAKTAHEVGDSERGWRLLKAADRFRFFGLEPEGLTSEAHAILAEASDADKGFSKWRRAAILQALADDKGSLRASLRPTQVARAKRILDEHQDNVYQKHRILKLRLRILTVISFLVAAAWVAWPPFSPVLVSPPQIGAAIEGRRLWVAVILTGILGALVSGFSSSMATDQRQARIPGELLATTVTFARISLAVLSSLAISIFLMSGLLNLPPPSIGLLLAVAFASGFSDRLLLRALGSLS